MRESFGYGFYYGDFGHGHHFAAIATSNLAHECAETAPRRAFSRDAIFTIAQDLVGKPLQFGHREGTIGQIARAAIFYQPRCHHSRITNSICPDINARQTARDGLLSVVVQVSAPRLASMDLTGLGCSVSFDLDGFEPGKTNSGQYALIQASGASEVSLVSTPAIPGCGIINQKIEGELVRSYGEIRSAPDRTIDRSFAGLVMSVHE